MYTEVMMRKNIVINCQLIAMVFYFKPSVLFFIYKKTILRLPKHFLIIFVLIFVCISSTFCFSLLCKKNDLEQTKKKKRNKCMYYFLILNWIQGVLFRLYSLIITRNFLCWGFFYCILFSFVFCFFVCKSRLMMPWYYLFFIFQCSKTENNWFDFPFRTSLSLFVSY